MMKHNLIMSFGFFLVIFTRLSSVYCKPNAPQHERKQTDNHEDKEKSYAEEQYAMLKNFVGRIKTRISYGQPVAEYKWVEGEAILDLNREKAVLLSAAQTAKRLNVPFGDDDKLFITDLMEATKLVEYVLISKWYALESQRKTPSGSVDLSETRNKITAMQEEIITFLSNLKQLQNSENCQPLLAKAIAETKTDNKLLSTALQRAFGNYCKYNIPHKS